MGKWLFMCWNVNIFCLLNDVFMCWNLQFFFIFLFRYVLHCIISLYISLSFDYYYYIIIFMIRYEERKKKERKKERYKKFKKINSMDSIDCMASIDCYSFSEHILVYVFVSLIGVYMSRGGPH